MQNIKFETIKKITETNFKLNELKSISKLQSNSPPSVFIGSKLRYPQVNVGILSPLEQQENSWIYDDAKYWANNNFEIQDVIKLRGSLLNSRFQSRVFDSRLNNKFVELAKQIAIASKPVDVEIELKNKLKTSNKQDKISTMHGMNAPLKKAKITSNTKVHQKVDKVINDELKANQGLQILYQNNIDEYSLSKILSVGVLGLKKNKRLVPTRWSITATDDSITKNILKEIRDYKWIENHELFFGEFLGNQYIIMLFPNVWSYELFELYVPGSSWNPSDVLKASTDSEGFYGRTKYVNNCAGGYYASRLPIVQYLQSIKRQASVLIIRIETPSYWAGLGVWAVRESVRKALKNKMAFNTKEELINSAKQISKIKYKFDNSDIINQSWLLKNLNTQMRLWNWMD